MRAALIATLVLIVILLGTFGYTCQRNQASTDKDEAESCQTWGGIQLLVIVLLMVGAVVMCVQSDVPMAAAEQKISSNEEYFYQDIASVSDLDSARPMSQVSAIDDLGDIFRA